MTRWGLYKIEHSKEISKDIPHFPVAALSRIAGGGLSMVFVWPRLVQLKSCWFRSAFTFRVRQIQKASMSELGVRRERRRFPVGARPTRQPLQPEATGAVMEATKWLKPLVSGSRIGDRASVQAATRVNAEQALYGAFLVKGFRQRSASFSPSSVLCSISQGTDVTLLLQLLYPMVVIIGDCRSERHRPGYPDLGQGDNERLLFIRGNNMAHDATFVAGIRQVRHDVLGLIGDANMLRSE